MSEQIFELKAGEMQPIFPPETAARIWEALHTLHHHSSSVLTDGELELYQALTKHFTALAQMVGYGANDPVF